MAFLNKNLLHMEALAKKGVKNKKA